MYHEYLAVTVEDVKLPQYGLYVMPPARLATLIIRQPNVPWSSQGNFFSETPIGDLGQRIYDIMADSEEEKKGVVLLDGSTHVQDLSLAYIAQGCFDVHVCLPTVHEGKEVDAQSRELAHGLGYVHIIEQLMIPGKGYVTDSIAELAEGLNSLALGTDDLVKGAASLLNVLDPTAKS